MIEPPAGWYDDPLRRAPLRFWDGDKWTQWISDGSTAAADLRPLRRALGHGDLEHLEFIDRVFLPEARAKRSVTAQADAALTALLNELTAEARAVTRPERALAGSGAPATVGAGMPPATAPFARLTPATAEPVAAARGAYALTPAPTYVAAAQPAAPPAFRTPSALSRWWARSREAAGSDLAVNWLAYLGVLLFFVGAFGLVVFAFGDVAPYLRPVAELVIGVAPFGASAMLLRRGAHIAGRALEMSGGLLLPVMVITAFVDGVGIPPDPHSTLLVVVLTAVTAAVGAGYAFWSRRHPSSGLRYLVAPVGWLAVAMATLSLGRDVPVGKGVATPAGAQVAAVAAALVLSVVWARANPRAALAAPTLTAAVPGLVVVALLAVLSWTAEGWPAAPVLSSGVLVLAALELLRERVPGVVLSLAEPLWWAMVCAALVAELGTAAAATAAVVGFALLVEATAAARRPAWALALPSIGLAGSLAATWADPWWAAAAFGGASVWVLGRRMAPFAQRGAAMTLDVAGGVLPALAFAALGVATSPPVAVLAASGAVLLATVPASRPLLRRGAGDAFWPLWWRSAAAAVAVATVPLWLGGMDTGERWMVTGSITLLAAASTVGPIPGRWRPWPATALFTYAWLTACATFDAPGLTRAGAVAVAGMALVGAAHTSRQAWFGDQGSLGLSGHALGAAAIVVAASGDWSLVVATGCATAGWCLTSAMDARDRSPVGEVMGHVGGWARWLPPALSAVGLPATAALALDTSGLLRFGDGWMVSVPAAAAVGYAVATRLPLPRRLAVTAAWSGFALGLSAALVAWERRPAAVVLGALVLGVVVLRPRRRAVVMTWVAWTATAPLAGLVAAELSQWFRALPVVTAAAFTLVSVGAALLVGGCLADLRDRRWLPRYAPARRSTVAPAVVGGSDLLIAVAVATVALPRHQAGWVAVAAAIAVLATALLSLAGVLSVVAALMGWDAVLLLAGPQVDDRPWVPVVVALALLLSAQGLSVLMPTGDWWTRWDLPLLIAAAPIGITALSAAEGDQIGPTFSAVGIQCVAVGVRLRRTRTPAALVAGVGSALVLAGAASAGPGWLALALTTLSAALTGLGARAHGAARTALQIGGALAALAAWQAATTWWGWPDQRLLDVTAVVAGVLVLGAALVARRRLLDQSWSLVWGGLGTAVVAAAAWDAEVGFGSLGADVAPSWPVAAGLLAVAVALPVGAPVLSLGWLRDVGVGFGLGSVVVALGAMRATSGAEVTILSLLSATCAVASLARSVRRPADEWRRPLLVLGGATALGALVPAVVPPGDAMLLVPGLAVSALQAAAAGVTLRNTGVQMLSPVLACAAWVVFSTQALGHSPQWVTMPIGLAILAVEALWRRDREQHGGGVATPEIVALELVGAGFLVGAAFVQAVTEAVGYAVLAAAVGIVLAGWGLVTRVRRRLATGAVVVLAALVILVAVPLVRLLPGFEGTFGWLLMIALGLAVVLLASLLEKGRTAVRKGLRRFAEATEGWE